MLQRQRRLFRDVDASPGARYVLRRAHLHVEVLALDIGQHVAQALGAHANGGTPLHGVSPGGATSSLSSISAASPETCTYT